MEHEKAESPQTLALSTTLEEDFVSPLTALRECLRLKRGVERLAETVYATGAKPINFSDEESLPRQRFADRLSFIDDHEAVELDLGDLEFFSSAWVNAFYDVAEQLIRAAGRKWFVIVNYRRCRIWPEAWVAFAHRGKKLNVGYSLGTFRYVERDSDGTVDGLTDSSLTRSDTFTSRRAALAHVDSQRANP